MPRPPRRGAASRGGAAVGDKELVDDGRGSRRSGPRRVHAGITPRPAPRTRSWITYTDRIMDVRLNGISVGEVGVNAMLAGTFGVPVALVTGDKAVGLEARALLGDRGAEHRGEGGGEPPCARHLSPIPPARAHPRFDAGSGGRRPAQWSGPGKRFVVPSR
ncbi:MAG: M55 family metallopeptidase [Gemmatimonadales bacterium]